MSGDASAPPPTARPSWSEIGRLRRVVVKHAAQAFRSAARIAAEWRDLNFAAPPELDRAIKEYDAFRALLARGGAEILELPARDDVTLDSIYTRDSSIASPRGLVLASMCKPQRAAEPGAQAAALEAWDLPVAGALTAPARLEGGDGVWLDDRLVAVGIGYRTNRAGIAQLKSILGGSIDELIEVPLPHWGGPQDVFHLMSMISPIDRRLALVYARLLPVPFVERLRDLGFTLVEVPDDEFESMGANVLAVAPSQCIALDGNPDTRRRLERAGAEVSVYAGTEISVKGGGGPTCLTRPVSRDYC